LPNLSGDGRPLEQRYAILFKIQIARSVGVAKRAFSTLEICKLNPH
jgi:hypothetical protein